MDHRPAIHFLHIGKTGGNAIKSALRPFTESRCIILHSHATRLEDVPVGDRAFFMLRDPLARFVSGFNSRLRKGAPRRTGRWTQGEERAFARFTTPNALAEALGTPEADDAMREIGHVRQHYRYWLRDAAYVAMRDVVLIGRQEHLAADFGRLKCLLDIPDATLPDDPVVAHVTPCGFPVNLSERGKAQLRAWYADDIALYEALTARAHQSTARS